MYVIISNYYIREVVVIKREGEFSIIRFAASDAGARIRNNRIYLTRSEAMNSLPKKRTTDYCRNDMGPWKYSH